MPHRTNAFQQLVALLESQLAPVGAIVTESGELTDPRTGSIREVDVVVELSTVPRRLLFVVECSDQRGRLDAEWMYKIVGKYAEDDVPLVLVSRNGFTREAQRLADAHGYETTTLAEATNTAWSEWIGQLPPQRLLVVRPLPLYVELALADAPAFRCAFGSEDARRVQLRGSNNERYGSLVEHYDRTCRGDDQFALHLLHLAFHGVPSPLIWLQHLESDMYVEIDGAGQQVRAIAYEVDPRGEKLMLRPWASSYRGRSVGVASEETANWYGHVSFIDAPDAFSRRGNVQLVPKEKPIGRMEQRFYRLPWLTPETDAQGMKPRKV